MWPILTRLFAALPEALGSLRGVMSSQATLGGLQAAMRSAAAQAKSVTSSPIGSKFGGLFGQQTVSLESLQQQAQGVNRLNSLKKQEAGATEAATKQLEELKSAVGRTALGFTLTGSGLALLARDADKTAHEFARWDSSLAKNVQILNRDRILRQQALARGVSGTGSEFLTAENAAEAATQGFRRDMKNLENTVGTGWENFVRYFGETWDARFHGSNILRGMKGGGPIAEEMGVRSILSKEYDDAHPETKGSWLSRLFGFTQPTPPDVEKALGDHNSPDYQRALKKWRAENIPGYAEGDLISRGILKTASAYVPLEVKKQAKEVKRPVLPPVT